MFVGKMRSKRLNLVVQQLTVGAVVHIYGHLNLGTPFPPNEDTPRRSQRGRISLSRELIYCSAVHVDLLMSRI